MPPNNFDTLITKAKRRYAPELTTLAEHGYDAQIRVVGYTNIYIPIGEARGIPLEMLVCNGDGLVLDEDDSATSTEWCAAVYSRLGPPLDIFCYSHTAMAAVQAAAKLLDHPVRVAVLSPTGQWYFKMLPAAALGDPHAEAALLAPQSNGGLVSMNVVVLDDDIPGWPQGCSTHSHCHPLGRATAVTSHQDCAHNHLTDWAHHGFGSDWWSALIGKEQA
ncbi:hypothetical protein ACL02S_23230 [Nocardia sp. 004]|uniref:hypothetical protein n=1 Tax=Nocardia sp. 004 TaxID=3385978 RepID=UPI0039A29418